MKFFQVSDPVFYFFLFLQSFVLVLTVAHVATKHNMGHRTYFSHIVSSKISMLSNDESIK